MNSKVLLGLISCIFAFLFFTTGSSQQVPDSLMHYLEIAAKNNPVVLQKLNEYHAALQKVPQVNGLPDPELNTGVFLSPMELVSGNQVADLRLMQMFPWFGTRGAAKDEMSLMANGRYETFREAKLQVFYDLQQTWYELYKVRQAFIFRKRTLIFYESLKDLPL